MAQLRLPDLATRLQGLAVAPDRQVTRLRPLDRVGSAVHASAPTQSEIWVVLLAADEKSLSSPVRSRRGNQPLRRGL
jgi:hypothetical protein